MRSPRAAPNDKARLVRLARLKVIMNIPDELVYSTDHEWVRLSGNRATIGITDYAQDALGDVVYVELPAVGSIATNGKSFGEIESTKSVSDLFAPVSGIVVEVNASLSDSPQSLNQDPYGDGWICVVELDDASDRTTLLSAEAYRSLTAG